MSSSRLFGNDATTGSFAAQLRVCAFPLLTSALLVAGCSSNPERSPLASKDGNAAIHLGRTKHPEGPAHDAGADGAAKQCPGPAPGSVNLGPIVVPTAEYVALCRAGGCAGHNGAFFDISQVGLDYGDFPFRSPEFERPVGEFFYAVVAPGYEAAGFRDGALGNLSDRTPSTAPGDLGNGDTVGDRTITNAAPVPGQPTTPAFFPESHGTHAVSFPDSGFMVILLAPFNLTTDGRYVLAVCPKSATSRCDCVFEPFFVEPAKADGGAGVGGPTGVGGAGPGGAGAGGAGAGGAAGGADCGAGGTSGVAGTPGTSSTGGVTGSDGGPCLPAEAGPGTAGALPTTGTGGAGASHPEAGTDAAPCDPPTR
jgi:hypothetical protein